MSLFRGETRGKLLQTGAGGGRDGGELCYSLPPFPQPPASVEQAATLNTQNIDKIRKFVAAAFKIKV